jgi:predicted nucleic acid-binding protein
MAHSIKDILLPESIIRWDVGAGESQVIAHCLVNRCRAVLDDARARSCALAHNIRVIGSLGIILRAKQNNLIPYARPLVEQLRTSGSYLDEKLIKKALKMVNEL